ncbi:hypothetical protein ACWDOP_36705 [Nocardia sp. NPDC003693]
MIRLRPQHRLHAVAAALGLGAAALVGPALAVVTAPAARANPQPCRIDRGLDTATFTCPDDGNWYAAVVRCAGSRQVGHGAQSPTYIVGDAVRPLVPTTIECNGAGKTGVVLETWTDGPF